MENSPDMATLNVVQQVLRALAVSLVAEHKGDMAQAAELLQAFASSNRLDPAAEAMILDISAGLDALGAQFTTKQ
ncbi:MAG: hypothetical protein ACNA75_06300 [Thiohalomonadaceae bacterium]